MNIDEARRNDQAGGVDLQRCRSRRATDGRDAPALHRHVGEACGIARAIDQPTVAQDDIEVRGGDAGNCEREPGRDEGSLKGVHVRSVAHCGIAGSEKTPHSGGSGECETAGRP